MQRNDYLKLLVEDMHSTTVATIGADASSADPRHRYDAVG